MQTFYLTDTGKVREHNEDNVIILHNENKKKRQSKLSLSHSL